MNVLILYDTGYGNTELIAKAMRDAVAGNVRMARVTEVNYEDVRAVDMLVVGSPTNGGRPLESINAFLDKMPDGSLNGKKVAAFDTRFEGRLIKMFGFAAEKIADRLVSKGGSLASPPAPFIVKGKKGPLKDGELERAASWAREIMK